MIGDKILADWCHGLTLKLKIGGREMNETEIFDGGVILGLFLKGHYFGRRED